MGVGMGGLVLAATYSVLMALSYEDLVYSATFSGTQQDYYNGKGQAVKLFLEEDVGTFLGLCAGVWATYAMNEGNMRAAAKKAGSTSS